MSAAAAIRTVDAVKPDLGAVGTRRFYDASAGTWMVKVFPGEFYVTDKADETLVTVLGSCVAACIRDPRLGMGGMNHGGMNHGAMDHGAMGHGGGQTGGDAGVLPERNAVHQRALGHQPGQRRGNEQQPEHVRARRLADGPA